MSKHPELGIECPRDIGRPSTNLEKLAWKIERGRGTAESKVKALREAGAQVVDRPQEIAATILKLLE